MRKAAGILMIIYGVITIGFFVDFVGEWGFHHDYPLALGLTVIIISAVFFITGGGFCLKRKYWKLCFASSLCLLLFIIFDVHSVFPAQHSLEPWPFISILFPLLGIIPQIFICLRKREWEEPDFLRDQPSILEI